MDNHPLSLARTGIYGYMYIYDVECWWRGDPLCLTSQGRVVDRQQSSGVATPAVFDAVVCASILTSREEHRPLSATHKFVIVSKPVKLPNSRSLMLFRLRSLFQIQNRTVKTRRRNVIQYNRKLNGTTLATVSQSKALLRDWDIG